jgi:hypothetical protein
VVAKGDTSYQLSYKKKKKSVTHFTIIQRIKDPMILFTWNKNDLQIAASSPPSHTSKY